MTPQQGYNDCGLFAIAYAKAICLKKDPAMLVFHQEGMRRAFNYAVEIKGSLEFSHDVLNSDYKPVYKRHKLDLSDISVNW